VAQATAPGPRTELGRLSRVALLALPLVVLALGIGLAVRAHRAPALPVLAQLPPFSLVDQHGRPLTGESLHGRVVVADFIFTRCAGVCPAMTARLARLRRELPREILFVSFTVDPGHDTAEVLARYAQGFGADEGWLFVTGPQKALYALSTEGFKLGAFEVPAGQQSTEGDGPFLHSSKLVLLDAASSIRGYYDSADEAAVQRLAEDARRLNGN
jgi:protein SCO1/2